MRATRCTSALVTFWKAVKYSSMEESRPRFEEGILALRRLWTEERVTFEGRFHRFHDVTVLPRPTQTPHPPIWVAAVVSPESFVWAGEQGYHMMVVPYLGEHHELAEKIQLYRRENPDALIIPSHDAEVWAGIEETYE